MAKEIPFLLTHANKEGVEESGPSKGTLGGKGQRLWDGPRGSGQGHSGMRQGVWK